jgi:hypothetical protein
MPLEMNRREALALGAASLAALSFPARGAADKPLPEIPRALIEAHDAALQHTLDRQVADTQSPWFGSFPDQFELHHCTAAAAFLRDATAAYVQPRSAFHVSSDLFTRMDWAAGYLTRSQNAEGNIDLIATNFNSPPDTAFVVHKVASAAKLGVMHERGEVAELLRDFLVKAGEGLSRGGIHTPNHRWVVCAALAQIHDLLPDQRYLDRVDQWLAEGIDIDDEGQFTERSTAGYNAVVNTALLVTALKLNRPALLDPVRKNLDAMAFLLHPNGEVVTEISSRQDLNTRGTMAGYWVSLRYLAIRDQKDLYAAMLQFIEPAAKELPWLMEYPELCAELPAASPIPDQYERELPASGITRIRRGKVSVTLMHRENSRWISLRNGDVVINAVRFASAFFGKGQFIPGDYEKRADGYHFQQELRGQYYQPLADPALLPVTPSSWGRVKMRRATSELCRLVYEAQVRELPQGIEISIRAQGTPGVPLAVEINLREGGTLSGPVPAPAVGEAFLLKEGFAEYALGNGIIRFGPGRGEHAWVQLRGAEGKLPGPSVYLTGYTPFEHVLQFELR